MATETGCHDHERGHGRDVHRHPDSIVQHSPYARLYVYEDQNDRGRAGGVDVYVSCLNHKHKQGFYQ